MTNVPIEIRPVQVNDAEAVNRIRRMPGVSETIFSVSSERISNNTAYFENLDDHFDHVFVALCDTEIVGIAGLHIKRLPRLRHTAEVGLMIAANYQKRGIGSKLFATLLDLADNWLKLVRVELDVFADNAPAIALYKKFGFEVEGVKRRFAVKNGEYADMLLMSRLNTQ